MKVLVFGDIFGRTGRKTLARELPALKEKYQPDFIIGNVENLAGGKGVNVSTYEELLALGFDGFTSGNHIWDNKDVHKIIDRSDCKLVRPANYPNTFSITCPGTGVMTLEKDGKFLTLINLLGRTFMDSVDCPFKKVDSILKSETTKGPILVDMHCETTSEKMAMGWHLDGRVAAVVGTHTHVQTADARLLHKGTAFITDIGMTGAFDSVIGVEIEPVLLKFTTRRRAGFQPATANPGVCCVVIETNDSHQATSIESIRFESQC